MNYILLSILLVIPIVVSGEEVRIELDQAASVSYPYDVDKNYYLYSPYYWVGTNDAEANHESLFGFKLDNMGLDVDEIISIKFYAQVALRHGNGGSVNMALGNDNTWNEQTATYNNTGGKYGNIINSNTLNAENLNQFTEWELRKEDIGRSIENEYLTIYLFTNALGTDGTNFHSFASERYIAGTAPYLLIKTVDSSEVTNNSSGGGSINSFFLLFTFTILFIRKFITNCFIRISLRSFC